MKDSMQTYFIIYFGEDGISITPKNKYEAEKFIAEFANVKDDPFVTQAEKIFAMEDNYPIYKCMIIKGEMIIPKPVEVVKKYQI